MFFQHRQRVLSVLTGVITLGRGLLILGDILLVVHDLMLGESLVECSALQLIGWRKVASRYYRVRLLTRLVLGWHRCSQDLATYRCPASSLCPSTQAWR